MYNNIRPQIPFHMLLWRLFIAINLSFFRNVNDKSACTWTCIEWFVSNLFDQLVSSNVDIEIIKTDGFFGNSRIALRTRKIMVRSTPIWSRALKTYNTVSNLFVSLCQQFTFDFHCCCPFSCRCRLVKIFYLKKKAKSF